VLTPGPRPKSSQPASDKRRIVCWQGWRIEIPRRWDPIKLEGDHTEGYALFADALRPRLGLRWQSPRKKTDAAQGVKLALRGEVGQLAADEAEPFALPGDGWQSSLLYTEPEPPGRDVFSGLSTATGRLLQIAYHAHRREHILAGSILPTLVDLPTDRATPWSVFDLNCVVPGGMQLKSKRLNAGDLGLTFADRHHELTIRQIAVATLALQRQDLDGWIADQQKTHKRHHRAAEFCAETTITIANREAQARIGRADRRRRFFLMWSQPREFTTIAAHDQERDRLIILEGTDESLLRVVAASVSAGNPP
jgi:hypothetical protein